VVEVSDQDLQGASSVALGFWNGFYDRLKQWLKILSSNFDVDRGRANLCVGVENRKVDLFLFGIEVDEEVVNFVQDFLWARVGAVDLVDDQNGRKMSFQRFA